MANDEKALEPARRIIDPHLHVWEIRAAASAPQEAQRFLLHEAVETIEGSSHNITHSIFVECHQMYRANGPVALRSLGETEFANGIAAMSESGHYGPCRLAHRIVGSADLRLGARVRPVLEAHVRAADDRFRGIRMNTAYSEMPLFGIACDRAIRHMLLDPGFQEGAKVLADMDLSLDVWNLSSQMDEVTALADAVPSLVIVLDHVGTPERLGRRAKPGTETFAQWTAAIGRLAERSNVRIKLGGLGMDISGAIAVNTGSGTSTELAERWRPAIETCIEAFSPKRSMFESNFPPDKASGSYGATWNAFKMIVEPFTEDEKDALFCRTAAQTYRIAITE